MVRARLSIGGQDMRRAAVAVQAREAGDRQDSQPLPYDRRPGRRRQMARPSVVLRAFRGSAGLSQRASASSSLSTGSPETHRAAKHRSDEMARRPPLVVNRTSTASGRPARPARPSSRFSPSCLDLAYQNHPLSIRGRRRPRQRPPGSVQMSSAGLRARRATRTRPFADDGGADGKKGPVRIGAGVGCGAPCSKDPLIDRGLRSHCPVVAAPGRGALIKAAVRAISGRSRSKARRVIASTSDVPTCWSTSSRARRTIALGISGRASSAARTAGSAFC